MASISRTKNGHRVIQFIGSDGRRRTIRLGKVSQRQAEAVKLRVEQLAAAVATGHPPDASTSQWVARLDDGLHAKLARSGLILPREASTLGGFLRAYISSRTDVKPRTQDLYEQTNRALLAFFDPETPLRQLTPGDGDEWRLFLLESGLAENTIRRRCGRAKQFLTAAVRKGLIDRNPFEDLKSNVHGNPERFHFVTRDVAAKILEACPDAQWQLLFALSRFGGLRCPSEHLSLRWGDVDWENGRITVPSPKTEHHPGGAYRIIPLFPELRPHLEQAFDEAEEGTEFVITRYRDANANLRTQLLRILQRAGVQAWPKLFHNLRSTRQTEPEETFPSHVVCTWIGNTEKVAAAHYLQVTDGHFSRAMHNPVQQMHAGDRNAVQPETGPGQKSHELPGFAASCEDSQDRKAPPVGLEPTT